MKLSTQMDSEMSTELRKLLNEDKRVADTRAKKTFDSIKSEKYTPVVFVGAGGLLKKILQSKAIQETIVAVTDNDPDKWGTDVVGHTVVSPEEAARRWNKKAVFVVSIWSPKHPFIELRQQFEKLGCTTIIPVHILFWKYHRKFLPYYSQGLPGMLLSAKKDLLHLFTVLHDEKSQSLLLRYVKHRLLSDFDCLPQPDITHEYFPRGVVRTRADEVFVDVGAYDGDSLRLFLAHTNAKYGKIIAFEPDPVTFRKLKITYQGLQNAVFLPQAVSDTNGVLYFAADGSVSSTVTKDQGVRVQCATLDTALSTFHPSYIKMDIEGSELAALKGTKKIIKKDRPMLAVCVYHKPEDIFQIPNFIMKHTIDYEFFLRNHDYDGIQLVFYAVPRERIKV